MLNFFYSETKDLIIVSNLNVDYINKDGEDYEVIDDVAAYDILEQKGELNEFIKHGFFNDSFIEKYEAQNE